MKSKMGVLYSEKSDNDLRLQIDRFFVSNEDYELCLIEGDLQLGDVLAVLAECNTAKDVQRLEKISHQGPLLVVSKPALDMKLTEALYDKPVRIVSRKDFDPEMIVELEVIHRAGIVFGPNSDVDRRVHSINTGELFIPWPNRATTSLLRYEVGDPGMEVDLLECINMGRSLSDGCVANTILSMRLARFLAQQESEGLNLLLTLLLHHGSKLTELAIYRFEIPLALNMENLRRIMNAAEAAQGRGIFMAVNTEKGLVEGVFLIDGRLHDSRKQNHFQKLTKDRLRIALHLPGDRSVEMYDANGMMAKYNGFSWVRSELYKLSRLMHSTRHPVRFGTERLIDALYQLTSLRRSSIIAIIDEAQLRSIESRLHSLRPGLTLASESLLLSTSDALVSVFRLDGIHFLDRRSGRVIRVAQHYSWKPADRSEVARDSGTGRIVARELSKSLGKAFVIKTSASSGEIKVFTAGEQVDLNSVI